METLLFVLKIITPFATLLAVGMFLARRGILDEAFATKANTLVFHLALPAMIVTEFLKTPSKSSFDPVLATIMVGTTVGVAVLAWGIGRLLHLSPDSLGPFIQGSFRSNNIVISMPLIERATGGPGLALALSLFGVVLPLYNLLAVLVLRPPSADRGWVLWRNTFLSLVRNPLILATLAGLGISALLTGPVPPFILKTGDSLAALAFPLAMMAMGVESMKFERKGPWWPTLWATVLKLLFVPLVSGAIAWSLGYRDSRLGTFVLFMASPTAVASYAMAKAMGRDGTLAASVVTVTTVFSVGTLAIAVGWLHYYGYLST